MKNSDKPQPSVPSVAAVPTPAQHIAPAAHSETAVHEAQAAALEAATQQATVNEELGLYAVEHLEGPAVGVQLPSTVASGAPNVLQGRVKRRPRRRSTT